MDEIVDEQAYSEEWVGVQRPLGRARRRGHAMELKILEIAD